MSQLAPNENVARVARLPGSRRRVPGALFGALGGVGHLLVSASQARRRSLIQTARLWGLAKPLHVAFAVFIVEGLRLC
jgi:hypothetical protein